MVPLPPTVTKSPVELVISSSLLLQEMIVRLKRKRERMMSICLNWFPISGLGEPNIYQNCGDFTRIWGFTILW